MTHLAEAAAFLAQQWPVFACDREKRPITAHGFKDAVRDPDAARRMFAQPGAALIGVPTGTASDLVVVDLDCKAGAAGLEWLAANEARLPATRRHRTRSGGVHLLFRYPEGRTIRNSASKLAPGVDVRGEGGYIISAPSDGYSIVSDAMPAPVPGWLLALLDPPKVETPAVQYEPPKVERTRQLDRYADTALAEECRLLAAAGEGGRNDRLNIAAMRLGQIVAAGLLARATVEGALTEAATACGLVRDDGLRSVLMTIQSGMQFGMRSPREIKEREAPLRVAELVKRALGQEHATEQNTTDDHTAEDAAKPKRKSKFATLSIAEVLDLPPPEWLVEGVLTCGGYAGIYGPPGSLKSFTVLSMGLAIAYGEEWAGRKVKQMGVLYVAGEGARGLGKRIKAWQQHHNLEGVDAPFRILSDGVNLTSPEDTAHLILAALDSAEAEGCPIGLVVIDTVARAMVGADENSATDMGKFNEACAEVIRGVPEAPNVLAVHHTGKDTDRGARGSNSFLGAVDTMLKITRDDNRLTLKVEKQKDDEDGFEIALKPVGIVGPGLPEGTKPYSLVIVDASGEEAPVKHKARGLAAGPQSVLDALMAAMDQCGQVRRGLANVPGSVPTVTRAEWLATFRRRSLAPSEKAKDMAFSRGGDVLTARRLVVVSDNYAWVAGGAD